MICPNCSHENEGGKFCENCGTELQPSTSPVAASYETTNGGANASSQYIEGAKRVSSSYINHFVQVIKSPYTTAQAVRGEQFINAIITLVLFAVFIPFMMYSGLKALNTSISGSLDSLNSLLGSNAFSAEVSFSKVALLPIIYYAIFILLIATFTFIAVKLAKVEASYKDVFARFGAFAIPFVVILFLALLLSLIKLKIFLTVFTIGFLGCFIIVPAFTIASFKKNSNNDGVDIVYGSLITFVLAFITIAIMKNMLFGPIIDYVVDLINPFS